jgi:hypothetical protein
MAVPKPFIPFLVVTALVLGFQLRMVFTQPSYSVEFSSESNAAVECIVEGLTCRGMSQVFADRYRDKPGIASIECYASERKAVISYDSSQVTTKQIRETMEQAQWFPDGSIQQFFSCQSMMER